jgi:hypothetical protein
VIGTTVEQRGARAAEPRLDQPENQKSVRLLTQDETAAGITRTAARVDRLNCG